MLHKLKTHSENNHGEPRGLSPRSSKQPIRLAVLAFICLLLVPTATAWGVVVFPKGDAEPIFGILISEGKDQVVVRELLPGNKHRDRTFLRSEIEDLLHSVSTERLESLSSDNPTQYRDYAEELAEKRRDPEARQAAIRLYLIAAHLDPENLGRGSLLGTIGLARTPVEERKFRAMAFLLDPDHNRNVLRRPAAVKVEKSASLDELLRALQLLRQGNRIVARTAFVHPKIQKQLEPFQTIVTAKALQQACGDEVLAPTMLQKILLIELAITSRDTNAGSAVKKDATLLWHPPATGRLAPLPVLSLETLTEFDPRKSHYQDGKWVDPDDL